MTPAAFDAPLQALDTCFEGGVPATLCTCAADGTPNVGFLSVVHRVDDTHVAVSHQFFRKTRKNIAENPRARLLVIEPNTAIEFRLSLEFVRTETTGPTFERLAASIAAVASQTGVDDVFALRGADIYRVTACERVPNGVGAALHAPTLERLEGLARCTAALGACTDLEELVHRALSELDACLGYAHGFLLAVDETEQTLFSIASHGYSDSGVGAEISIGEGLIGMAAERRTCVRVANMSREQIFAEAVHRRGSQADDRRPTIPLPGLERTQSQLAVPLLSEQQLLGVLCLQSPQPAAFGRVDEQIARVVADQLASSMARMDGTLRAEDATVEHLAVGTPGSGRASCVRRYADDDSIFVDNEYLIRGVAGRVLWLLLDAHERHGRREFTNRELRLDPALGLPRYKDNLETRLIMLRKRLDEKCPFVRIRSTGRGRFELQVSRPLNLEQV